MGISTFSSTKSETQEPHVPVRSEPTKATHHLPENAPPPLNPVAHAQFGPSFFSNTPRPIVQAKMTVGPVGDAYEQEADTVAHQVVQNIQRQDEDDLQMKPLSASITSLQRSGGEEEDELQMQSEGIGVSGGAVDSSLESTIQSAKGNGSPLSDTVRQPMEQAFGADFSKVRVHNDATSDSLNRSIQAKAFTTGSDVFFRSGAYQPTTTSGQELLAHELTHTIQQGAVQRAGYAQRAPSNTIQRYVDGAGGLRTSSGGSIALANQQDLYAAQPLITSANDKLRTVASGLGAFITLQPGAAFATNPALLKVTPQWVANRGQQSVNHKQLHQAQQPHIFKTQNDCYMTASLAAGIDDRDTGTGETTYGKYNVQNRNNNNGEMTRETTAPLDSGEMERRGVSKPTLAGGGMPYQAAIRNLYKFYTLNMPVFRNLLAEEYRAENGRHTPEEINDIQTSIITPINQAEQLASPTVTEPTALQMGLQMYLRIYATISQRRALYRQFSSLFGVNEAVNPEVGDALAIMNDPKERDEVAERIKARERRGEAAGEDELWNYHFAGVVMKEEASGDYITLENAADETHQKFNQNWGFYMYGSRAEQPDQTFQGQLQGGAHGPGIGHSPLTMAFVQGKAPKPIVEYPTNNSVITSPTYTIRIRPEGSINNVRVQIDAGDWNQARFDGNNWFFDWSNYSEGPHTIKVEAWNQNGQRVQPNAIRVRYTPPEDVV